MLDEPAVVLLAAAASAVCLLLEVALPTVGLAGTAGLLLAGLAAWGADRQGEPWWPLLGVVAAVTVWGVLVAVHRRPVPAQLAAAGLFLAGALGYAASTDDGPAAAAAVVATAVLAGVAFPRIAAGAERLDQVPAQVGLESLVGTSATVVDWDGRAGHVVTGGTRWSATGPESLAAGDVVTIVDATGLSLAVEGIPSRHG